ncbi:MAG TPA: peptidylprolyl isomerase [Candidatus Obscuribacterales bacterium]
MKRFIITSLSIIAAAIGICVARASAQSGGDQMVALETSKGRIVIRVFYSIMPYTAGRFLDLVDNGFYNGLTFHRVENWVIQGGDPTGNGTGVLTDAQGRPQYLHFESNPSLNHNAAGAVAMARSKDPNSASCQFYITKGPMPGLNGQYAVFGRVVSGANAVMNMQRGDRIISATILQPNRPSADNGDSAESTGGMSDENAVPGYRPDPPARAPRNAMPSSGEAAAAPPKPKPLAKYSLPGSQKPVDAAPLLRHSVIDGARGSELPAPKQQQQPPPPEQPKQAEKPPDSGF